jgi:hypothetical protein
MDRIAMTTYQVLPSGNQWRVQKEGGSVVSNHRKKQPAVEKAKSVAGSGDQVQIHRSDGTVQDIHSY